MNAYKMIVLDGKVPLSSVVKNNIMLLQNYINNGQLGELSINLHPNNKRAAIIFTAAHENVNMSGLQMYLNSLSNEMQMDNGMSYVVGNETSEYDLQQFTETVKNIFPEILQAVNNVTGLESAVRKLQSQPINSISAGVEDSAGELLVEPKSNETKISNEMIYSMLINMCEMLGGMKSALDELVTNKKSSETIAKEPSEIPKEQIPEAIKDNDINPIKDEPAAEVATPTDASVPDNNITPPPQSATQSNNSVEEVKTTPEVDTEVLNKEDVDSTTSTVGVESEVLPEGDLGDVIKFVNSLKNKIPGLESSDLQVAENSINNYIISNISSGEIPSNIARLFNEYFFIESAVSGELKPLDRVTQVRRQLSTNQYL